jgi:Holliday junction resolvase RusA-like endonuclease
MRMVVIMDKQEFIIPGVPVSKNGDRTKYIPYKKGDPRARQYDKKTGKWKTSNGFILHYLDDEVTDYANKIEQYILAGKPRRITGAAMLSILIECKPCDSMKGSKLAMALPNQFDDNQTVSIMPTTKPDLDNLEKNIMDALKKHLFVDDSYVCSKYVDKRFGEADRVIVTVKEIGIPVQWSVGRLTSI